MLNQAKISRLLGSTVRPLTPDAAAQLAAHKIIADAIGDDRGVERFPNDRCDQVADEIFKRLSAAGIAFTVGK